MEAALTSQTRPGTLSCADQRRRLVSTAAAILAGLGLRVWMYHHLFEVRGDSLVYGGIAKNLLEGRGYALTLATGETFPTLIRLPGYPLFLALSFRLFGMENYAAAVWLQIALDLAGCLLLAGCARRIAPPGLRSGASAAALWLAALCPFTASYAVIPLTETPTLFAIALALWAVSHYQNNAKWALALLFTFAVTLAALLRPDGAILALALAPAMLAAGRAPTGAGAADGPPRPDRRRVLRMAAACTLLAITPFLFWTWRNWRVYDVFEPLAPRSATDPGDPLTPGWDRWVRTWCLDFVCTYEVDWNVPGAELELGKVPGRAFDTPEERERTARLAAAYNRGGWQITPELDAAFGTLAEERIARHPLRYYLWFPLLRVADMWVRPRVENLPIDVDWWSYAHHRAETRFSWFLGGVNILYLAAGAAGLALGPRLWRFLLAYLVLRSALLFTVVPPEARYTLEAFPILFVTGGVFAAWLLGGRGRRAGREAAATG